MYLYCIVIVLSFIMIIILKICLTSYQNHYVMYARSLEEAEIEHYYRILQRVALCAQTGKVID